jgi:hypothetical protein
MVCISLPETDNSETSISVEMPMKIPGLPFRNSMYSIPPAQSTLQSNYLQTAQSVQQIFSSVALTTMRTVKIVLIFKRMQQFFARSVLEFAGTIRDLENLIQQL